MTVVVELGVGEYGVNVTRKWLLPHIGPAWEVISRLHWVAKRMICMVSRCIWIVMSKRFMTAVL